MTHNNANDLNLAVDANELKPLFKTKAHKHAFALAVDWAIILATAYFCLQYFHPLTYILAVLIIGARMHALAILMHDASHYRFLKNRKWNDLLTNLFILYPLFSTVEQYRQNHMKHHRHLNTDDDPDWISKLGKKEFTFPKTKREFLVTLSSYLILYRGVRDAIWFLKRFQAPKESSDKAGLSKPRLIFTLSLLVGLTVANLWGYYLLFWVVPYFSTFFMFQYIRSVAEHYGELAYDNLLTSTRSVKPNLLERFFIAPHQVGFHLEHHLYPAVPFYNLPQLHQLLMQNPEYNSQAHITQGYVIGLMNELGSFEMATQLKAEV